MIVCNSLYAEIEMTGSVASNSNALCPQKQLLFCKKPAVKSILTDPFSAFRAASFTSLASATGNLHLPRELTNKKRRARNADTSQHNDENGILIEWSGRSGLCGRRKEQRPVAVRHKIPFRPDRSDRKHRETEPGKTDPAVSLLLTGLS